MKKVYSLIQNFSFRGYTKLLILCFFSLLWFLSAESAVNSEYSYRVYPPVGWKDFPQEEENSRAWISPEQDTVFMVSAWPGHTYISAEDMYYYQTKDFKAEGSLVPFTWENRDSVTGEVTFSVGEAVYKGYLLFINGKEFDYYLTAFTFLENYEKKLPHIFSCLDSFTTNDESVLKPGPITRFYSENNTKMTTHSIDLFGHTMRVENNDFYFDAAQTVIEREALIMKDYSRNRELFYDAWKRYYQIIYRDNSYRVDPLFKTLKKFIQKANYSDYNLTEVLMFWHQTFEYERYNSLSDLLAPVTAGIQKRGDCDSRALLLGIILKKYGIHSILLVSEKVKHALLAVDIPGEGARYQYKGKGYLVLELTTQALPGEIKQEMADPDLWTPVELEY